MRQRLTSTGAVLLGLILSISQAEAQLQSNPPPSPEYGAKAKPSYNPITAPIQLGNRSILSIDPSAIRRSAGMGGGQRTSPAGAAPPTIMGFPNFGPPPNGLKSFPGQTGLPVPFAPGVGANLNPAIAVTPRAKDSWPSWFKNPGAGKFTPENALLVRGSDRVWYLSPEDSAFIPLAFYDRFRRIRAGSEVEVRHKGEFQVSFHGGGTMRTRGPVRLVAENLNEEVIALALERVTRMWLTTKTHPYRLTLPDESVLEALETEIYFDRKGDQLTILHDGTGTLTIRTSLRTIELRRGNFIRLALPTRTKPPLAANLNLTGDLKERQTGRVLQVNGGARGGAVVWNGAQFRLSKGSSLRIDPLVGEAFPANRKKNQ